MLRCLAPCFGGSGVDDGLDLEPPAAAAAYKAGSSCRGMTVAAAAAHGPCCGPSRQDQAAAAKPPLSPLSGAGGTCGLQPAEISPGLSGRSRPAAGLAALGTWVAAPSATAANTTALYGPDSSLPASTETEDGTQRRLANRSAAAAAGSSLDGDGATCAKHPFPEPVQLPSLLNYSRAQALSQRRMFSSMLLDGGPSSGAMSSCGIGTPLAQLLASSSSNPSDLPFGQGSLGCGLSSLGGRAAMSSLLLSEPPEVLMRILKESDAGDSCKTAQQGLSQLGSEMRKLQWLGQGGCGVVFRAEWKGATVAVKLSVCSAADQLDGFREALMAAMLAHPNVVHTYLAQLVPVDREFLSMHNANRQTMSPGLLARSSGSVLRQRAVEEMLGSFTHQQQQDRDGGASHEPPPPQQQQQEQEQQKQQGCSSGAGSSLAFTIGGVEEAGAPAQGDEGAGSPGHGGAQEAGHEGPGPPAWLLASPGLAAVQDEQQRALASSSRGSPALSHVAAPLIDCERGPQEAKGHNQQQQQQQQQREQQPGAALEPFGLPPLPTSLAPHCAAQLRRSQERSPPPPSLRGSYGPSCFPMWSAASGGGSGHITGPISPLSSLGAAAVVAAAGGAGVAASPAGALGGSSGLGLLRRNNSCSAASLENFSMAGSFSHKRRHTFAEALNFLNVELGSTISIIVMEHCDRGSLQRAIAKGMFLPSKRWGSGTALRSLVRTCREVAQGMAHLHAQGVVHGDLKPANVLLKSSRTDKRGFTARVSDFGHSTFRLASRAGGGGSDEEDDDAGMACNTPLSTLVYMSPEAVAEGKVHKPGDVWAFGLLMWQMVTGKVPHADLHWGQVLAGLMAGTLTVEWPDAVPSVIRKVARACLQPAAAARPDFETLVAALTRSEECLRQRPGKQRLSARDGRASGSSSAAAMAVL